MPPEHTLILAVFLFATGLGGILTRRNTLFLLISLQLILSSSALVLALASRYHHSQEGGLLTVAPFLFISIQILTGVVMFRTAFLRHGVFKTEFLRILRG